MVLASDHSVLPLSHHDAPALQRLYERCNDYMELVAGTSCDPTEAEQLLRALPPGVAMEQKLVLGLWGQEDQLLGAVDVIQEFPRMGTWYIGELLITPDARHHGLGRVLFRSVVDRAVASGAHSIELAVHESNAGAAAFWHRMGFEKTGQTRYRVKELESTFVLMRAMLRADQA